MNSLYIHIPFCLKKCNYCAFVSFCVNLPQIEKYFDALQKELAHKNPRNLKTLYIGGGTPSCVPIEFYRKIKFDHTKEYEFTFEVNPKTVDKKYLQDLRTLGVNRLSIGVQSLDDKILTQIGRPHSAKDAIDCVKQAQEAGFDNISIDLIYGLPNQTMKIWRSTLTQALSLGVQHISTYGLKIEEGTPFGQNQPENLPDEDLCADMYLECVKTLTNAGFEHYEVSNFALNGFESLHNSNYWQNNPYIACGIAAHGYEKGIRYENTTDLEKYLDTPLKPAKEIALSKDDILAEAIFLGLRLKKGIDLDDFKARYSVDFKEKYAEQLAKFTDFFEQNGNKISLTTEGFMLSNVILAEFL